MPVAPSFDDLITQGEAAMVTARSDLALNDGDVTEADLHAAAAMADAIIRYDALSFKETFIDGAEGDALTTLVNDHLNIQRSAATFAQVVARFTRTSGGAGGTIVAGSVIATLHDASGTQVRFVTDADFVVSAADNGPFSINATAEVAGREGNVAIGTIEQIITTLFDSTFTVTNLAAAAGGNAEESDEQLRRRAKAFYATLRRGTLSALEYGALQVDSVRVATASEDLDTGLVTVLVGDGDGNSTMQMVEAVEFELENWRAAGVNVTVLGATQVTIDLTITLASVRAGFDVEQVAATLVEAIETRGLKQMPGQTLFLDTIIATVIGVFPDDIFDVQFDEVVVDGTPQTTPADVEVTVGQVIRFGTVVVQ